MSAKWTWKAYRGRGRKDDEFSTYGASRTLLLWCERKSPLAEAAFSSIPDHNELALECLGGRNTDSILAGKILIERLWARFPQLGPYPLLDVLSEFQFDNKFLRYYRDHVAHQYKVFLLGLYVFDKCRKLRDAVEDEIINECGDLSDEDLREEFLLRWTATAVFHDVGYVLEQDDAKNPQSDSWKDTQKALDTALRHPVSQVTCFRSRLTEVVEKELVDIHGIPIVEAFTPAHIEYFRGKPLFDELRREGVLTGLATNPTGSPALQLYYKFARSIAPDPKRAAFYDHGIVSALILMRTWKAYEERLIKLGGLNDPVLSNVRDDLHSLVDKLERTWCAIRAAAGAIALHNVDTQIWQKESRLQAVREGLHLDAYRIRLTDNGATKPAGPTPLAFLLSFTDTLQDWDRPRFRASREDDPPSTGDQDMFIGSRHGRITLHLKKDEDFAEGAMNPQSRFKIAFGAMKAFLEPTVVDELLAPADERDQQEEVSDSERAGSVTRQKIDKLRTLVDRKLDRGEIDWFEFENLSIVDPNVVSDSDLMSRLIGVCLDQWEANVKTGELDRASEWFERVEALDSDIVAWREEAAIHYAEVMRRAHSSEVLMRRGVSCIRQFFMPLTSVRFEHSMGPYAGSDSTALKKHEERIRDLRDLRKELAGHNRTKIEGVLDGLEREHSWRAAPPWWKLTADLLRDVWSHKHRDGPAWCESVPPNELRDLLHRAPEVVKEELVKAYTRWVPRMLPSLLLHQPRETLDHIDLVCELAPEPPVDELLSSIEEIVLKLDDRLDTTKGSRFFECGGSLYMIVLAATPERQQKSIARRIVDQANMMSNAIKSEDEWDVIINGIQGLKAWLDLLQHPAVAQIDRAASLRTHLEPPPAVTACYPHLKYAMEPHDAEKEEQDIAKILNRYEIKPLPGEFWQSRPVSASHVPDAVRQCMGMYRHKRVCVKIYDLPTDETPLRGFLEQMWQSERRVLIDVSTRQRGRGITSLVWERRDPSGRLILVTDAYHRETLRDLVKARTPLLTDPNRRNELWQQLHAIMEATHALHQAHFVHRNIRPENILITEGLSGLSWKLGNFEQSFGLHALSATKTRKQRWIDRYRAPEMIKGQLEIRDGYAGENFSSDVYSLGLLLYEVLVEHLRNTDLGSFHVSYNQELEQAWNQRCMDKALQKLNEGQISGDEYHLIVDMLRYDVAERLPDLTDAVSRADQLAYNLPTLTRDLKDGAPLYLASTLKPGEEASISNFIARNMGVTPDVVGESSDKIQAFVEAELRGARIYRNAKSSGRGAPLLLEGRHVTFTAEPFRIDDQVYDQLLFLKVANQGDIKIGRPLASLPDKAGDIQVKDLQQGRQDLTQKEFSQVLQAGSIWEIVLKHAEHTPDHLPIEQRRFHTVLQLTERAERMIWEDSVIPYRSEEGVKETEDKEFIRIKEDSTKASQRRLSLPRFIASQLDRENYSFELSRSSDPIASFNSDSIWMVGNPMNDIFEGDDDGVIMSRFRDRGGIAPPTSGGYLRPHSLRGNRAIHSRRHDLLRRLEDDVFLLRAISEPERLQSNGRCDDSVEMMRFFNTQLDADKRAIVRRVLDESPLLVVQGPPGTGKTTLATEVLLQLLVPHNPLEIEQYRSARVLVTSQAHAPLNHLLLSIWKAVEEYGQQYVNEKNPVYTRKEQSEQKKRRAAKWERLEPVVIRMPGSRPPHDGRDPNSPEYCAERLLPWNVAERYLERAKSWELPDGSPLSQTVLSRWHSFLSEEVQSALRMSLCNRLVASANVVVMTANDRSVNELPDDAVFDLLIYEEAAKAYPLEVLGPMRLARRWLLIGDHAQLPPFNHEEFEERIQAVFDSKSEHYKRDEALQLRMHLGIENDNQIGSLAARSAHFFKYLHGMRRTGWSYKAPINGRRKRAYLSQISDALTNQWRMHPEIGSMLRETGFYEFMQNADGDSDSEAKLREERKHGIGYLQEFGKKLSRTPLLWINCPEATEVYSRVTGDIVESTGIAGDRVSIGGGYRNPFEATVIHHLLKKIVEGRGRLNSLLILAPYRAQVKMIQKFLVDWPIPGFNNSTDCIRTVDSAQGRQAEVVIVSLTRNNPAQGNNPRSAFGFMMSLERAGVMFSRAERLLIIVGCRNHFAKTPDSPIAKVYSYIDSCGEVLSAGDLLEASDYKRLEQADKNRWTNIERKRG